MMTEDASAARSARGARPLDLKARIRSQRSGEGKGGDLEAGGIIWVDATFTGGERRGVSSEQMRPSRVPPGRVVSEVRRTPIALSTV